MLFFKVIKEFRKMHGNVDIVLKFSGGQEYVVDEKYHKGFMRVSLQSTWGVRMDPERVPVLEFDKDNFFHCAIVEEGVWETRLGKNTLTFFLKRPVIRPRLFKSFEDSPTGQYRVFPASSAPRWNVP